MIALAMQGMRMDAAVAPTHSRGIPEQVSGPMSSPTTYVVPARIYATLTIRLVMTPLILFVDSGLQGGVGAPIVLARERGNLG